MPGDVLPTKSCLAAGLEALSSNASTKHFSACASLFLFRKLLPSSGLDPLPDYFAKLSKTPIVDPDFVRCLDEVIPDLFPMGWDSQYSQCCEGMTINDSACLESYLKEGNSSRGEWNLRGRDKYVSATRDGEAVAPIPPVRGVKVLEDGGKKRIVTIANSLQWQLAPLHRCLYDHLSKFPWLLRGDASVRELKGLRRKVKEVFVSGDYEAATDNFNSNHSELILRRIAARSTRIPSAIWDLAFESLRGLLIDKKERVVCVQSSGQMMGNLLSFPLLCVTNYLGVCLALGGERAKELSAEGRLKINGDDIVFRSTREEYNRWATVVSKVGLVLSQGKTVVNPRFFSINSAFFMGRFGREPKIVPVIRPSLYKPSDTFHGMVSRMESSVWGWTGVQKQLIAAEFLRKHQTHLIDRDAPRRKRRHVPWVSLTRGVGWQWLKGETLLKASPSIAEREWVILESSLGLDRMPDVRVYGLGPDGKPDYNRSAVTALEGWKFLQSKYFNSGAIAILKRWWSEHCVSMTWDDGWTGKNDYTAHVEGVEYRRWAGASCLNSKGMRRLMSLGEARGGFVKSLADLRLGNRAGRSPWRAIREAVDGIVEESGARRGRRAFKELGCKVAVPIVVGSLVQASPCFRSGGVQRVS